MTRKAKKQGVTRSDPGVPSVAVFGLEELQTADYNPRVISDEALAGLTHSVQRFGCVEPIVVNVRGGGRRIVGGHQRLKALAALGVTKVLCVTVRCTPAEEKLLNLTLNNPLIQGRFIREIESHIAQLRQELGSEGAFVDLRITALQRELGAEGEKEGRVPDDDVPKPPKKAVTKPGDLWRLGEHRLLCGDSTQPADVERLMGKDHASRFATDPPYCVDYTGRNRQEAPDRDWPSDGQAGGGLFDSDAGPHQAGGPLLRALQRLGHADHRRREARPALLCDRERVSIIRTVGAKDKEFWRMNRPWRSPASGGTCSSWRRSGRTSR